MPATADNTPTAHEEQFRSIGILAREIVQRIADRRVSEVVET